MSGMWVLLAVNTGIIQFLDHDQLARTAAKQSTQAMTLKAARGTISDRNGEPMAVTMASASYAVWPRKIRDKATAARVISAASGIDLGKLRSILNADTGHVYLLRHADRETMQKMDAALDSIDNPLRVKKRAFERTAEQRRRYPLGKIGSHVIGYTDVDCRGIEGLEKFFNRELAGSDGRSLQLRDAKLRTDRFLSEPVVQAQDGLNMRLTIDWRIQEIAEEELEAQVEKSQAKYGGIIILDSATGEILAMANAPRFDPNDPASFNKLDPNYRRNRLVTDMIEPGSTFKVITFAEAFETGVVDEDDLIDCHNGAMKVGSNTVHDSHKLGVVTAAEVLIHSSNIGTTEIALRFGKMRLYERARMFGFGEVTGSDFPNETKGMLPNPRTWSNFSLPTISYGQGVAVSPLQLAAAYGAIANGGELLSPRIIRDFTGRDGHVVRNSEVRKIRRVMSKETANRLTNVLCRAVEEGTGENAAIPGIRVAGKTGTAQRIIEGGRGYAKGQYVASFAGFISDREPRLVCVVIVDSPSEGSYYGAQVASPVFRNVVNRILNMGNSPVAAAPSKTPVVSALASLPDVCRMPVAAAARRLQTAGFTARVIGDPTTVARQFPLPGTALKRGAAVTLYTNSFTASRGDSIAVPNLTGKSLREAVADLVQSNLKVKVAGSGIVNTQTPPPGTLVACGSVCELICGKR